MRFYRVHFYTPQDASEGFSWHTTLAAARAAVAKFKESKVKKGFEPEDVVDIEIKEIEIDNTKQGILDALNTYAKHPDNG